MTDQNKPRVLRCDNCGAPLEPEPNQDRDRCRCKYCGAVSVMGSVADFERLRPTSQAQVMADVAVRLRVRDAYLRGYRLRNPRADTSPGTTAWTAAAMFAEQAAAMGVPLDGKQETET